GLDRYAVCVLSPPVGEYSGPVGLRRGRREERTMKNRLIWGASVLLIAMAAVSGCQSEGPAENAGKQLDKAGRDLKGAVVPPGPAEKAGRAVDDAINK